MTSEAGLCVYLLGMVAGAFFGRTPERRDDDASEETLLRRVALALTKTGDEFLPAVVSEISRSLGASLAFVGELTDDQVEAVAVCRDGEPAGPLTFLLHGSATGSLAAAPSFCHPDRVQELFPDDAHLAEAGARGCVGVLLTDTRQAPIGVIVAATGGPIAHPTKAIALLTLFAGRVAAEMQRTRTERELRAREEHLLQVQRVDAVGRLAGGIAHDFNNLLMIIIGYAEILKDRGGDSVEVAELLGAANRAARLTRQLLAFGRRQVLRNERIDLNRVVEHVEALLVPLLGPHVQLQTALDPDLPAVVADPGQFEQVLVNLALNARDAMPDGGTLLLRTRTEDLQHAHFQMPAGRYVCLSVTDSGVGMSPDVQAHIFEPFFTTRGSDGSGLGLSSVYGIVKQSGGFIWCHSEPSQGTTFTIYLHPATDDVSRAPGITAAPEPADASSEHVLVVDDDPGVRRLITRLLRARGYVVSDMEDGASALAHLESSARPIDLVVTDIVMPGMSGVHLAREIERRWPSMKVLLVTGYAEGDMLGARDLMRPLLPKPFTPLTMATAVRNVLEGKPLSSAPRKTS